MATFTITVSTLDEHAFNTDLEGDVMAMDATITYTVVSVHPQINKLNRTRAVGNEL